MMGEGGGLTLRTLVVHLVSTAVWHLHLMEHYFNLFRCCNSARSRLLFYEHVHTYIHICIVYMYAYTHVITLTPCAVWPDFTITKISLFKNTIIQNTIHLQIYSNIKRHFRTLKYNFIICTNFYSGFYCSR